MAVHTLTFKDGRTVTVNAPEDTSRQDLVRLANRQITMERFASDRAERAAAREQSRAEMNQQVLDAQPGEESGFLGDIAGGFASGVVGLGETAALGAATLLDEEKELAARERIQRIAGALTPSMGDEGDLTYKVGQAFGSIAGALGVGAATAYGGAAAGLGATGAGIAGLLGAGTVGVGAGAGEASERAREFGATEEERNRAALRGALIGSTEALPLGRALGPIASRLVGDLGEEAVQTIGGRIARAARTGGEEAAQEAAANILQNLNERGYNAEQAILEGAGEAGAIGGVAGGALQLLVDTFLGRRARGAGAGTEAEPTQGELFGEDVDLGRAPVRVMGEQREMFPEEDLGMAPERPDERQLNLFTEEGQRAAGLERRAREADAERARMMEQPIAGFETEGDPFLERTKAERDRARAALAEMGRPAPAEPEQRDMIRELEQATIPEEEQRAQAAAREREALRAAGRGDEAAFEQPDLFALQQEQERRRLGPEELRRPDQFMDVPEAAEPRDITVRERDLVDMADERQRAAQEEADIADQLAAIEAEDAAQQAQAQAVRAESDLETIAGQQETQRMQTTERNRTAILQDVIEKTPSRNYNTVRSAYEAALAEQGFRGDRAKATPAEVQSIQRAVNVQRAERPVQEPVRAEPITAPPEATQLAEMEARIPERTAREPEQLGMPGIRRRVQQAPVREGMPQEAAPEPQRITDAMLDEMGISPKSPIRQRLRGKDIDDPTARQILTSFANKPRTPQRAQLGISRALEGVPEAQPDLFTPRGVRRAQPTQVEGTQDAVTAPDTRRAGEGATGGGRGVGQGGRTVRPAGGTGGTAAPRGRGLGGGLQRPDNIRDAASKQLAPLEAAPYDESLMPGQEGYIPLTERPAYKAQFSDEAKRARQLESQRRFKEFTAPEAVERKAAEAKGTRRPTMPVLEVGKKRTEALAPKPVQKKAATRTGETKASIEAKLLDAYDANTNADHKRFVKALKIEAPVDPMTVADKEAVLKVLNTKSSKELKPTIGAVKKYLGAYEDPILGLQDAIDDVVSATPNFRKAEDMTAPEIAFFGPDTKAYLPARGKNAAQATLDWAAENMSADTKRWMQTALRDAKQMNVNIAAFESTDLVAKRKEIETLLKDGFDMNDSADMQALTDLMEKLGIDDSDPMLQSMLYKGGMFNMAAQPENAPLPNVVKAMLRGGDLPGALRALAANTSDPDVRAVAEKLAKVAGNTQIKVAKSIAPGVLGRFTAAENTISLAEDGGLNTHVLLHEMTHAATAFALTNKGHPLTRKLQKIFDETREHMPTAYGYTNLDEFVAEAFSNSEFQRMLAGLKVNGDPLTPFAKIKAVISNFLRTLIGKPTKPVESALEQTTGIIDNILAPAPSNIGGGEFFMMSPRAAGKQLSEMLGNMQKSAKPVTKEFAQKFSDQTMEFLRGSGKDKAKRALVGFLPSQAVADVAQRNGVTGAMKLHKLMEEQRGAINTSDQEVEGVLKSVANWAKANKDRVDTLNKVVYTSTIEQVDPSKPRSAYDRYRATFNTPGTDKLTVKTYTTKAERDAAVDAHKAQYGEGTAKRAGDPDPKKLAAYDAMRANWRQLGAEGQKVYAQMRDTYKKQYERMRDVIYGKIDETITDEEARKKLKNEVYARLFETGTIEPYFPLTRSGDYWLSYTAADGEYYVEAFETLAERDRAMADLKADESVKDVEKFVNLSNANFSKAPPSSFVGQTLQTLRANKVDDKVQAEIMRLFVEALPETSFAKSLQRRKGTKGYQEDAIHALKTKAFDLGRQVERLRYSAKIRDLQDQLVLDNKDNITEENKYLLDELQARADFARNPPKDSIAQAANRAAFVFTIGFNASSALVNLSQLPLFVYPMLGGKYGYVDTGRAIKDASKLITSSGFSRKSDMVAPYGKEKNIKVNATPSIDNYFELDANGDYVIRDDLDLDADMKTRLNEIKPLMEMMAARGQLNRSLFADNLGIDSSGRERSVVDTVSAASAFMFHNVEVFNRQVTALTAYQLELERLKKAEPNLSTAERQQKAAEQALYDTQQTNGGSVLETAPRLSQQGIGRVAMMYKTYGVQMYYSMFKTVRDGVEAHFAGDKDARNQALRQFSGVMGMSFLLAGVVGMPLARELMQLMNLLFFDEEEDSAETRVRKAIGEGFYKGPLTALLDVDLSSRIGLSGLLLQANRFNHDASLEEDVFHYLGGPAWSVISSYNRGYKDIINGEIERGVEAMLPGGVRNAYQAAFRFPRDEGILTRRGDPIMDDLSFGQLAAKFIGFAPAEYTRTQEMTQQTKGIDRAVSAQRTLLLRKYYVATRMGDYDESQRMMRRIGDFNRRHPSAAITPESFRRSIRQHMETSATMYNGVTLSPSMRNELARSMNEWDQGWQLF
jgi:hypothetical protein